MPQFLETIKIADCKACNLKLHQERVDKTFAKFFPNSPSLQLKEIIDASNLDSNLIYKCRIEYDSNTQEIQYLAYTPTKHRQFKLVDIADYEYKFKFADRSFLNDLIREHEGFGLLLVKDGLLTDSTYSNLVFYHGNLGQWYTPDTPLLNGTMRQKLLRDQLIIEKRININTLDVYSHFNFINAMMDLKQDSDQGYQVNLISFNKL